MDPTTDGPKPTIAQTPVTTYQVPTDSLLPKTQAMHKMAMQKMAGELADLQQQYALFETIAEQQAVEIGRLRATIAALQTTPAEGATDGSA